MENRVKQIANAIAEITGQAPKALPYAPVSPNYPVYLNENSPSQAELDRQREEVSSAENPGPRISIIMLGKNCSETDVNSSFLSLMANSYTNWELILAVGLSYPDHERFAAFDNVRTILSDDRDEKLISSAEAIISGSAVMLMFPGDRLSPNALYLLADAIGADGRCDLVYADNDQHDEFGRRLRPLFKPAFSPVTEACFDYIGRPLLVGRNLHFKVGGFISTGAEDLHKYAIRCCRAAKHPANVPEILLSIKETEIPCAEGPIRLTDELELYPGSFRGSMRISPIRNKKRPVSILIPAPKSPELLRLCLETIDSESAVSDYKLMISVGSDIGKELKEYLAALKRNKAAAIVRLESGTEDSIPALLNSAAARARTDHLIFLSPNAETLDPCFIENLIAPLLIKGVAVCGGKLLGPNDNIYSTGTVIGLGGYASSAYLDTPDRAEDLTKAFYTSVQRNVTAVSGCFMAVKTQDFLDIGMFDETFPEVGWDAEFCMRAAQKGYGVVYTPYASAKLWKLPKDYPDASDKNLERCRDVFRDCFLKGDPHFSNNYDYRLTSPQLAIKPAPPIKYGLIKD